MQDVYEAGEKQHTGIISCMMMIFPLYKLINREYRGLVQYYILAQNLSWFSKLYWYMETSLLKTLACKHRSSINKQRRNIKPLR